MSVTELDKGARIGFVFHELFSNAIKGIDPFDEVQDGDIRTILYNSSVSILNSAGNAIDLILLPGLFSGALRRHCCV